jgi:hypothetical protein
VQRHGPEAGSLDATYSDDDAAVSFGVDIAPAYPAEAGLICWRRNSVLDRAARTIHLHDEFCFTQRDNRYEQRFMTVCPPHMVNGDVVLDIAPERSAVLQVTPRPDRITLHAFALEDGHLQRVWGDTLYQIRLHFDRVMAQGHCHIVLNSYARELGDVGRSEVPYESAMLP